MSERESDRQTRPDRHAGEREGGGGRGWGEGGIDRIKTETQTDQTGMEEIERGGRRYRENQSGDTDRPEGHVEKRDRERGVETERESNSDTK